MSPGRKVALLAGRAALGGIAGLVAGLAMTQLHTIWSAIEERLRKGEGGGGGGGGVPATVRAAEAVVGRLDARRKAVAGDVAHYMMSAATGAFYTLSRVPASGAAYGAAVWIVADELMVPLLRLSEPPWRYPFSTHVRALLAHLVYGVTLDASLRAARRLMRS